MNRVFLPILALAATLILAACSPAGGSTFDAIQPTALTSAGGALTPDAQASQYGAGAASTLPDGALPKSSTLALGILKLEGTAQAVTTEQAAVLLPLWQMMQALNNSDTSAKAEVEALLQQIQDSLSAEQVQAIAAMNLTQAEMMESVQQLAPIQSGDNDGTPMPRIGGQQGAGPGGNPGGGPGGGPPGQAPGGDTGGMPQDGGMISPGGDFSRTGTPRFLIGALIALLEGRASGS